MAKGARRTQCPGGVLGHNPPGQGLQSSPAVPPNSPVKRRAPEYLWTKDRAIVGPPTSASQATRAAGCRGVFGRALRVSASGTRSISVGTLGTNPKIARNPLSPLRKSVPTWPGDKPFFSGDSGDNSFHQRAAKCGPWFPLVIRPPVLPLSSAKVAPAPRPQRAARLAQVWLWAAAVQLRPCCGHAGQVTDPQHPSAPPAAMARTTARLTGQAQRSQAGCDSTG